MKLLCKRTQKENFLKRFVACFTFIIILDKINKWCLKKPWVSRNCFNQFLSSAALRENQNSLDFCSNIKILQFSAFSIDWKKLNSVNSYFFRAFGAFLKRFCCSFHLHCINVNEPKEGVPRSHEFLKKLFQSILKANELCEITLFPRICIPAGMSLFSRTLS